MPIIKNKKIINMKYYLLKNSLVVFFNNNIYTISNDDYRFENVKKAIEEGNLESAGSLIDPNFNINKNEFIVNEGVVWYRSNPIPTVLGNKLMQLNQDSFEFRSIFNFWLNVKSRLRDDSAASEVIFELVSKDAYVITENGFYLAYKNLKIDQTKSVLNKRNQQEIFHFYNYATCPNQYFAMFEEKKSFNNIIKEIFGTCTKKIKNIAIDRMFQINNNFINYDFLFYGEALKDVLAIENIIYAIEKNLIDTKIGDICNYQELKVFLEDYSMEKTGGYSQKKIINFLESATDKNKLSEIGSYYVQVKRHFNFNIQDINISNDCNSIHEYLERENKRIKTPFFTFIKDCLFEELNDVEFGKFRIMVPKNNHDLMEWGLIMHNCIGNYGKFIKNQELHIIAIVDKITNEMIYTADICKRQLRQLRGKNNCEPDPHDRDDIIDLLKSKNLIYKE